MAFNRLPGVLNQVCKRLPDHSRIYFGWDAVRRHIRDKANIGLPRLLQEDHTTQDVDNVFRLTLGFGHSSELRKFINDAP